MLEAADNPNAETCALQVTLSPTFGGNFWDDIAHVLESDPKLKGDFYHMSRTNSAPNPGLSIDGLDFIGLPLSSREARIIMGYALADSGNSQDTLNMWKIKADRVKVTNPAWSNFVETAVKEACSALGVASWQSPVGCSLSQLLLLSEGQQLPIPEQGHLRAHTFASLMIVLPSPSATGKFHMSFDVRSSDFELAQDPFATNTFAWYNGVTSEFRSLGSGHHLALLYHLDHQEDSSTPPKIPSQSYIHRGLQHVFQMWHGSEYLSSPEKGKIAVPLKTRRSSTTVRAISQLETCDKAIVKTLGDAISPLGYRIFFGQLVYHNFIKIGARATGDAIPETQILVRELHEITGAQLDGLEIPLQEGNLVPKKSFAKYVADSVHLNKETGIVDQCFTSTVLLIVSPEERISVLNAAGVAYSLEKLRGTRSKPVGYGRMFYELMLDRLSEADKNERLQMMRLCLSWKDVECWKDLISKSGGIIGFFGASVLVESCEALTFKITQPTLREMILKTTSLKDRVDLVEALYEARNRLQPIANTIVEEWCKEQYVATVASLTAPGVTHVPELIRVAVNTEDICILEEKFLPNLIALSGSSGVDVVHALVIGLREEVPLSQHTVKYFTHRCVKILLSQPKVKCYGISRLREAHIHDPALLKRITKILELCIVSGDPSTTVAPLTLLLHADNYQSVCSAANLVRALSASGLVQEILGRGWQVSEPFKTFFRALIGIHMHNGAPKKPSRLEDIRDIDDFGCCKNFCQSCYSIREFFRSGQTTLSLEITSPEKRHLDPYLSKISTLVKNEVSYRPMHLILSKNSGLLKAQKWQSEVIEAKHFLRSIGKDEEIRIIMGSLHMNVNNALEGIQPFEVREDFRSAFGTMNDDLEITPPNPLPATSKSKISLDNAPARGVKRIIVRTTPILVEDSHSDPLNLVATPPPKKQKFKHI